MELLNRINRIAVANSTLQILKDGYYRNSRQQTIEISSALELAKSNSIYYHRDHGDALLQERDQVLQTLPKQKTLFEVTPETTLAAAERLIRDGEKIFCLNFASARNPGGGFLNGSQAQEESLARSSGLFPCIDQMTGMYAFHRSRSNALYADDMIYSPDVPVFRKDNGDLLDQCYTMSFLTSPAVNAGVVRERQPQDVARIDAVMMLRLEKILSIAVIKQYETLLLGAWGCGVFRNDPRDVADYFRQQLTGEGRFAGIFKRVVFAVYDSSADQRNLKPFMALGSL